MTDVEFSIKLIERGIVVTPGSMISDEVNGANPGKEFVRFALVPIIEDIKKAADIIRNMDL